MKGFLNYLQQKLASSPSAIRIVRKIRNQCHYIISIYLTKTADSTQNGEYWLIEQIAPQSEIFIDVGANVGNWSEFFMKKMTLPGKGILFEPSQEAYHILQERFSTESRIELIHKAVSNQIGEIVFYEEPSSGETSSLSQVVSNSRAVARTVSVTTIQAAMQEKQVEYIDFLKIDVEGYDFHVLQGAHDLLAKQAIGVIQFEYNKAWMYAGSTLFGAIQWLKKFDYETFLLQPNHLLTYHYEKDEDFFGYSNFVALSPEMQKKFRAIIVSKN